MLRRLHIDWRTAAGFSGLLFLIIAIGFIGIRQIQGLSHTVSFLAQESIPLQNSVLEMKSTNSKYAMGMRSYMFWRSAKYLDSAAMAEKLNFVRSSAQNFDKLLSFYANHAAAQKQKAWVETIRVNQEQLRQVGESAISLVNQLDKANIASRRKLEEDINKHLMGFENKLFQIDAFLDSPLQEDSLKVIDQQLSRAQRTGKNSIIFLLWSILIGLGLGAQTVYLIYRRNKIEQEHRELLWRKIIRIEEEERSKLAFEIHDQLGQDLSGLKIYLGLAEKDLPENTADAREKIDKARCVLKGLMDKAHNISELLRPPELDDLGLAESIDTLISQYKEITGGVCQYKKPVIRLNLPSEHSLALYRVVQEALTNIAKYSKAKNVTVSLDVDKASVSLLVTDDGQGFDYEEYVSGPSRRKDDKVKLGLRGLRERVEVLGGRFNIKSKIGQGTQLEVELPIA